ncbi:hypothetical protein LLG46_08205 [bacterium]|nr:hypothetical protein [bacterium]
MRKTALYILVILLFLTPYAFAQDQASQSSIWFGDIAAPLSLSGQDQASIMKILSECLLSGSKVSNSKFPDAVSTDMGKRIVFVSLFDGKSRAQIFRGEGLGLSSAINCALTRIASQPDAPKKWSGVRLDIVRSARMLDNKLVPLEPGLNGLATGSQQAVAVLADELIADGCVRDDGDVKWDKVAFLIERHGLKIYDISSHTIDLMKIAYTFTTDSLYTDGRNVMPLYRGHTANVQVTSSNLLQAVKAGGDYLKWSLDPNGRFTYNYMAGSDKTDKAYNYVRHAGTIYAMCEVYGVTGDRSLLVPIRSAIDYLMRLKKSSGNALYLADKSDSTSLGCNALAALALAEYTMVTKDRRYVPTIIKLGRWIEMCENDSGEFVHKVCVPSQKALPDTCSYYPGEATFALMRIAKVDKQSHWITSAQKAAKNIIAGYAKVKDDDLPNDQWFLYALNELYRVKPKSEYMSCARRLVRAEIVSQTTKSDHPDEIGLLRGKLVSNITAVEGLCAAYAMMRDYGSKNDADAIKKSLQSAVRYQMQLQYRKESSGYLPNPRHALGGVTKSFANTTIRIDTVQHFLSGCIQYYKIIKPKS